MSEQINQLADFVTKNTWVVAFLAIFGFFSALIGTWLSIRSYKDGQKNNKRFESFYEIVDKNIDKTTTEEEIEQKRKKADEISGKIISLQAQQDQIKRDIPIEAKKAVLQDRLNSSVEDLTRYYHDIQSIRTQLDQLGSSSQIPEDLLRQIGSEIQPKFLLKEKIASLQVGLTIITGLAAIAPVFVPNPIDEWLRNLLLIISIPIIFGLFRLFILINESSLKSDIITLWTSQLLVLVLFSLTSVAIIFVVLLSITFLLALIFLLPNSSVLFDIKLTFIFINASLILLAFLLLILLGFVYERSRAKVIINSATSSNRSSKIFRQILEWVTDNLDKNLYVISKRVVRRIEDRLKRLKQLKSQRKK